MNRPACFLALALAASQAGAVQPDVLVIFHGYDGDVESAGTVTKWQYTGTHMLLEYADTDADGIFRNGFEAAD